MVQATPKGHIFLTVGVWTAAAGAVYGLISLSYYGLGFSMEPSAWKNIQNQVWPEEVKINIQKTYIYLFFALYICVTTAFFVYSHPLLLKIFSSIFFVILDVIIETFVEKGNLFTRVDSTGIFSVQKIAWISYCVFIGALSSSYLLSGIESTQNALRVSFVIVAALTILSLRAPLKKYYSWMKKASIAEDVIIFANIGASLIPVKYTLGAFFFSLSLYGGLLIFPINFLSHAQAAHIKAYERNPPYCPPAMSIPLLLTTMNFFTRILLLFVNEFP